VGWLQGRREDTATQRKTAVYILATSVLKAARSGTRGRPPFGLGGSRGNSGAMLSHRASLTNGLLIRRGQAARPVPRL
jgi:hypothetical protein